MRRCSIFRSILLLYNSPPSPFIEILKATEASSEDERSNSRQANSKYRVARTLLQNLGDRLWKCESCTRYSSAYIASRSPEAIRRNQRG